MYPVILFYQFVEVRDPEVLASQQRTLCASLGLKGRIIIATEGINGTLAGPADGINQYVAALKTDARFSDIEIKVSAGDAGTFPKLVVKVRPEIVTLNAGPLPPDRENHLSPAEWKRMMEENPDTVLLDIRNRFESAAGRFANAIACDIEHFRELPGYVNRLEGLKDKTVLMYCTGGIRCEKASTLFKRAGFNSVFQLHGGIAAYQEQFGNDHWQGECFVFDQRMTVRVEEGLIQIGQCAHSGRMSSRFVNCLHDPCHKLFILSAEAEAENPDHRLCPECLTAGITFETADY
ncbi:MAG TPA: rhodanese-related sulfurtransferase [Chthoniobacterales bacterium]|nr:rhodanese-related sulfurtransferase [Chthoniobacterales bacterium]